MRKSYCLISMLSMTLFAFGLIIYSTAGQPTYPPKGWSSEIYLSEDSNSPLMTVDGSYIHVIWGEGLYNRSADGGNTWMSMPSLTPMFNHGQAIKAKDGMVHFTWGDDAGLWYKRSDDNGDTWSERKHLGPYGLYGGWLQISVHNSYVHVIYEWRSESPVTYDQIYYVRSTNNGETWENPLQLSQNTIEKGWTGIATSGNYVHIIWREYNQDDDFEEIHYRRSLNNGASWESEQTLVQSDGYSRVNPVIAANKSNVHLVWLDTRTGTFEIFYKRSTDNGVTWDEEDYLPPQIGIGPGEPSIVAYDDHIRIVHPGLIDLGHDEIYYIESQNNGESWSDYIRLTNSTNSKAYPVIGVLGNSVHVVYHVWLSSNEEEERVWYMRTIPNILPTSIQLSNNPTEEHLVMINTTIDNNGYADAYNVNVTCFINETFFSSQIIDLLELYTSQIVQFQWTPSGSRNYNIRIDVDPQNLSYEWDETDNNLSQAVYINAIPKASINADRTELLTSEIVSFDASDSSDDGTIVSYYIDFGDGNTSGWKSSPIITHSYARSGTYTASLTVEDEYNIESENPAQIQIQVLNRPPEIEIDYPTGGVVGGLITISGTSSDPDGEVEIVYVKIDDNSWMAQGTTSWSYDWDTTKYSNGEHSISVKAYDGEDYSEETFETVTVDNGGNVAPKVTINHPNDEDIVSDEIEIRGTASDEDGFIQIVELQIGEGNWKDAQGTTNWKLDWDTTTYPNGEYIIRVRARDDLGLYSQEKTIDITVDNGVNNPPTIEIESHSGGEIVDGTVEIKGSASDQDGNVDLVEIKIDDGDWITITGTISWMYSWDTTLYSNGEHEIYVRSRDDIGDYSHIKSITLIIDNGGNVPPIVDIISPTGGTVSGIVIITGRASDIDGDDTIESVQVKIDDNWEYAEGIAHWSYSWDTTNLDDGNYTIYVRAYDGTEYSIIKSLVVFVDNPHKPILIITSEIPETAFGMITIKGTASDSDGEVTKVEIQIDNGEWKEVKGTTDWSYELDTTKLSNGKHTIKIIVYDDEGEFYIETFDITVNNSDWTFWLFFALLVIILTVILCVFIVFKKKKRKS